MSEKKTIQFNPEFLRFANNKTRKKRPEENKSDDIKVRAARPKKKDETFKKASILRMIRKHQEEKYNQMIESFSKPAPKVQQHNPGTFKSEFEESKQFMDRILEQNVINKQLHNTTLKSYPVTPSAVILNTPLENLIQANVCSSPNINNEPLLIKPNPIAQTLNLPQYGCLKNGNLPTYRKWTAGTQRNRPVMQTDNNHINNQHKNNDSLSRASEVSQKMDKINLRQEMKKKKRIKQKRIVRRTFKIGKSKVIPKVSVLISNKSIRNKISTEGQLIKQKPLEEIKKYLIKRGLIRVGTTAPNDVLRKMYECSIMMCGELQNHNPDNLLYNYLNSEI
jgi:hypothetical protein